MVANVKSDGCVFIKVPMYLIDYDIEMFMQCRGTDSPSYMPKSETTIVKISSFLLDNDYKSGDFVRFRDEKTFYTTPGEITEVLDGNMFKITYYANYEANDEIVHVSRMHHQGTDINYEIDLIPKEKMRQNLLIRRKDKESKQVFEALIDVYGPQSINLCLEKNEDLADDEELLNDAEGMSVFVAKNVFDFLYEPRFLYKVDCLLDGDEHSMLHLRNLRQTDIRTKLEMEGVDGEYDDDEMTYRCDACLTGLRDYDFVFQCSAGPLNRHDFCMNCVNTVIEINQELNRYLNDVLNDNLNNDCIREIISFVIGNVVCFQHT